MSPSLRKTLVRIIWATVALVGLFLLYALSLGPVLRLFDTEHAPAGYNSLPSAVRLFYYPLQHVPWPGIYQRYLIATTMPPHKPYVPTQAERAAWPKTVDQAVTRLIEGMDDADKKMVRDTKKEDLIQFHHGWGTGIRNEFGLWKGNTNLLADCHAEHPDDASMVIVRTAWERLQKQ
jgi:hypothetical protein